MAWLKRLQSGWQWVCQCARRLSVPYLLSLPLCALGIVLALSAWWRMSAFERCLLENPEIAAVFNQEHTPVFVGFVTKAGLAFAAFLFLAGLLGMSVKKPWVLTVLRQSYMAIYGAALVYVFVVIEVSGVARRSALSIDGVAMAGIQVALWQFQYLFAAAVIVAAMVRFHLNALSSSAIQVYSGTLPRTTPFGDLAIESVRLFLSHPRFKSASASVLAHVLILFFPLLLQLLQSVSPYLVPFGKGQPDAGGGAKQKTVGKPAPPRKTLKSMKITMHKPRVVKGLVFDPNAGRTANLDTSLEQLAQALDTATDNTFDMKKDVVTGGKGTGTGGGKGPGKKRGGVGQGGEGPGGWPNGMKNGCVRFIHLEYDGEGWNDGMQEDTRGDMNFLDFFHEETDFKIASAPESNPIRRLKLYPKGFAPPFVYMTGKRGINIPPADYAVLREYLLDGGMIFASCSSPEWHQYFLGFAATLFPDYGLVDISDDDPIFKQPYEFPNGAPPLWHHGGTRAKGIKVNGRWVVFYHPGDINDAWKTGHSGMDPQLAEGAFQMGFNIVYYAFTQYLENTAKYRK